LYFSINSSVKKTNTDLSNSHRTENVKEDEATVGEIIAGKIAMTQALNPTDRCKWQFGYHAAFKAANVRLF
jgi:hypothetical protein